MTLGATRVAASDTLPGTSPDRAAEVLLDVAPMVTRWIRGEMRRASADSLTVPQLRALLYVRRRPGTNLSALAEHLGVGVASASGLVDRLVRQGLLARAQDPQERRRVRLELTPHGDARVQQSRRLTHAALVGVLDALSAIQLEGIQRAFGDLRTVFQSDPAPNVAAGQPPSETD